MAGPVLEPNISSRIETYLLVCANSALPIELGAFIL